MDRAGCSKLSIVVISSQFFPENQSEKIIKASVINLIQQLWGCPTSMCKMWSSGLETLKLAAQEGTFSLKFADSSVGSARFCCWSCCMPSNGGNSFDKDSTCAMLRKRRWEFIQEITIAIAQKSGKGRNTFEEEILQARDARDFLHNCRDWFIYRNLLHLIRFDFLGVWAGMAWFQRPELVAGQMIFDTPCSSHSCPVLQPGHSSCPCCSEPSCMLSSDSNIWSFMQFFFFQGRSSCSPLARPR